MGCHKRPCNGWPLAGTTFTPLKSITIFWFGWKDFHPDTLLHGEE
jgi:hypothetical protein